MDLALNEEQEIIKNSAQSFLKKECPSSLVRELEEDQEGFSPELWRKMADLGWMGLIFPGEYGGSEGNFLDLVVLMEEMGKALAPSWFFSSVVLGAQTIMAFGTEEQKERLLPEICSGESKGTLALMDPQGSYDVRELDMTADRDGDDFLLDGIKLFVPDAHIADWMICVTKGKNEQGVELFIVDKKSPGISLTPLKTISGDKLFEVSLEGVKISPEDRLGGEEQTAEALESVLQCAALAKCAEMVGGAQMVLDMAVDYA